MNNKSLILLAIVALYSIGQFFYLWSAHKLPLLRDQAVKGISVIKMLIITSTPTKIPTPTVEMVNCLLPDGRYYLESKEACDVANEATPTPVVQQTPQYTIQTINCDVTANVPDPQPVYAQLTPQQCAYEQEYAVQLWNQQMGQQQSIPQMPAQQYQPQPLPQFHIQTAPTFSAPPVFNTPAPPQVPTMQAAPAPVKTCHIIAAGNPLAPEEVCY